MKRVVFLWVATYAAYGAGQSVSLINTPATVAVPNSTAFTSLTSSGSYWIDFRVTAWSLPASGCQTIAVWPGAVNNSMQMRVCASTVTAWRPFTISAGSDVTQGGSLLSVGAPHIAITSVTATNPMALTLASAPSPISMAPGRTITIWGASCADMNGDHTITDVAGGTVTIDYDGSGCSSYTTNSGAAYSQDFLFRLHRDRAANLDTVESWNVDGSGYSSQSYVLVSAPAIALPNSIAVGPGNVSFAFFRWYAGTIATGAKPPSGQTANAGGTVLADWEFDGDGKDGSGNGLDLNFGAAPQYTLQPNYPPACNPGRQQSWRAGERAVLDGSHSFPLDGGESLTYTWQQAVSAEPGTPRQRLKWSSRTVATPTVAGFVAGPLNFRLTVTDGSGASASCAVHHGAVATDDLGNVAIADPKIANILGPMIQWGNGNVRWPFLDTMEKSWADLLGPLQGQTVPGKVVSDFRDLWNVAAAGTVTVTYGDYRAYGTGTSFQSSLCAGGKFPVDSQMIFWYPSAVIPGGYGRRLKTVGKCVSDTVVDFNVQWSDDDGTSATAYHMDAPPAFRYAEGGTLTWRPAVNCAGGPTTVNVNGLGAVPLKKADGATDPSPADCAHSENIQTGVSLVYKGSVMTIQGSYTLSSFFRWTATTGTKTMQYAAWGGASWGSWINGSASVNFYDNVLAYYAMYYRSGIDSYLTYARWLADKWWSMPHHDSGYADGGMTPRVASFTGLVLRAIDQDNVAGVPGSSPMWPGLRNEIDAFYRYNMNVQANVNILLGDIRETSYNDMWVAFCAAYDPDAAHAAACRSDLNNSILRTWKPQRQAGGLWQNFIGSYTSVANSFSPVPTIPGTVTVTPGSKTVTLTGGTWSASMFPAHFFSVGDVFDATTRDTSYYNATLTDPTHIELDRPYAEVCAPTCSGRQWVIGPTWVGFGAQPFQLGIVGQFFNQAHVALSMDPQYANTAALAKSYVVDAANWIATTGVQTSRRGLWYGVGYGVCAGPNPTDPTCSSPDAVQSRELSPEAFGTLAMAYIYSPSPTLLAAIDNLYSAVYAKYPSDPGYDGIYASDMDGFNYGSLNPKWQGFYWGMGRNAAWPSARQNGLLPERLATVYVEAARGKLAGGGQIRATVTDPTGFVRPPVICNASPCAVTVNRTLGNPLVEITEVSAGGIATSEPIVVQVK